MFLSNAHLHDLLTKAEVVVDEFFAYYEHDDPSITNSTIEAIRRLRSAVDETKSEVPRIPVEQLPPHSRFCDWCGEFAWCNRYQLGSREVETGYLDEQTLCGECSQIFEEELHDRAEQRARHRGIHGHRDER